MCVSVRIVNKSTKPHHQIKRLRLFVEERLRYTKALGVLFFMHSPFVFVYRKIIQVASESVHFFGVQMTLVGRSFIKRPVDSDINSIDNLLIISTVLVVFIGTPFHLH